MIMISLGEKDGAGKNTYPGYYFYVDYEAKRSLFPEESLDIKIISLLHYTNLEGRQVRGWQGRVLLATRVVQAPDP